MRTIAQKYRDEGIKIGQEKGKLEGKEEGKLEIAKYMIQSGEPLEKIVRFTGLSRSRIQDLL
ncbi:MAG: hypothetical protein V3581_01430 [Candidatus Cardinium sp.]